jgi:hypothetical protein
MKGYIKGPKNALTTTNDTCIGSQDSCEVEVCNAKVDTKDSVPATG